MLCEGYFMVHVTGVAKGERLTPDDTFQLKDK